MTAAPWTFIFFSFLHAIAIGCEWGTGCNIAFGTMVFLNYLVLQVLFCKFPSEKVKVFIEQPLLQSADETPNP
jgi:hypothetical protein